MCEIGTMHERVAMPPTCTVQAPQALMPQPNFVPVSLRSSRSTQSRGVEGSTFTSRRSPFTVNWNVAMLRLLSAGWTRHAGIDPAACGGDEFFMRERRQRACRAVGLGAGVPGPFHARLPFVMFQYALSIEMVILRTICERPTNFSARKRVIMQVLPTHRERREVPVVTARNSGAVRVGFLMTAGAIQTGHAFAFRTTHDIRDVTMSVVSLLWVVRSRVTVDAARMSQDGIDLLPPGEALRGSYVGGISKSCRCKPRERNDDPEYHNA